MVNNNISLLSIVGFMPHEVPKSDITINFNYDFKCSLLQANG